jgi:hypothetical protein
VADRYLAVLRECILPSFQIDPCEAEHDQCDSVRVLTTQGREEQLSSHLYGTTPRLAGRIR